jgi:hypothetical protein
MPHGPDDSYVDITAKPIQYGRLFSEEIAAGVPTAGEYVIRIRAAGVLRHNELDPTDLKYDPAQPIQMAVLLTAADKGGLQGVNGSDVEAARFELPDDQPTDFELRVWLEPGYSFRLTYPNGPPNLLSLSKGVLKTKYGMDNLNRDLTPYHGPRVRVFGMEIDGPYYPEWPRRSHTKIFGAAPANPDLEYARKILTAFAGRAFRRPVTSQEMAPILDLVGAQLRQGSPFYDAARQGLKAILCSPQFLHHQQQGLYGLADRLSFFLWNSIPDEALLRSARQGDLRNPRLLRSQIARMLKDDKRTGFSSDFLDQWLGLRHLGEMAPDEKKFAVYYERRLQKAMRDETRAFFGHVLSENLEIRNFIDSDFAFVNQPLAELYGIPGVEGPSLRKVALKPEYRRGGLLTQASVLTLTANGIDTSPVIRGVWVLSNFLGTPPAPPPSDVVALEPDIRGTKSIRELLEKHRQDPICMGCHRKFDPLGFALEGYDPIGRWRDGYDHKPRTLEIDSSGSLPDGKTFRDLAGLKKLLLASDGQLATTLVKKLLTYGLGRELTFADRPTIDAILEQAKPRYRLGDLVRLVAMSPAFIDPENIVPRAARTQTATLTQVR